MKWLIPRLKDFNELNSGFDLKITTNDKTVNFSNVDIAIRRDDINWKEHIYSIKLMDETMFFVKNSTKHNNNILISS